MRAELIAFALLASACATEGAACSEIASRPVEPVAGRYVTQAPAFPDASLGGPSELFVDRDAGTVTLTTTVDGGRVVARYRILAR